MVFSKSAIAQEEDLPVGFKIMKTAVVRYSSVVVIFVLCGAFHFAMEWPNIHQTLLQLKEHPDESSSYSNLLDGVSNEEHNRRGGSETESFLNNTFVALSNSNWDHIAAASSSNESFITSEWAPTTTKIVPKSYKSRWAYVYLLASQTAGSGWSRGYFYNILVSARMLRQAGSKADIVVMIQMTTRTNETRLLPEEEEWFLGRVRI